MVTVASLTAPVPLALLKIFKSGFRRSPTLFKGILINLLTFSTPSWKEIPIKLKENCYTAEKTIAFLLYRTNLRLKSIFERQEVADSYVCLVLKFDLHKQFKIRRVAFQDLVTLTFLLWKSCLLFRFFKNLCFLLLSIYFA